MLFRSVAEYTRQQTGPDWLPTVGAAVARELDVPGERLYLKQRRTGGDDGPRYGRLADVGTRFVVRERDLRFWVNLTDRLDTGLFSDHRDTRRIVRDLSRGTDFLNLYAYTGTFTCAAVLGGAKTTVTVDRSATYCDWVQDNLALNGLAGPRHERIQADTLAFLERAAQETRRWDLVVVDPPSFSQDRGPGVGFDIQRDHPDLLARVLAVTAPGGTVFFSTNHQRFEPRMDELPVASRVELTPDSIPPDYRNRRVHRCWRLVKPA